MTTSYLYDTLKKQYLNATIENNLLELCDEDCPCMSLEYFVEVENSYTLSGSATCKYKHICSMWIEKINLQEEKVESCRSHTNTP